MRVTIVVARQSWGSTRLNVLGLGGVCGWRQDIHSVAAASRLIELVMDNYAQHKCLSELSACVCACVCAVLTYLMKLSNYCAHINLIGTHTRAQYIEQDAHTFGEHCRQQGQGVDSGEGGN